MKKRSIISLVAAAALAVGTVSATSLAGNVTTLSGAAVTPITVANEWTNSLTGATLLNSASSTNYGICKGTLIDNFFKNLEFSFDLSKSGGTLAAGNEVNFILKNGIWSSGITTSLVLADADSNAVVGEVDAANSVGSNTLSFTLTDTIYSGKKYFIADNVSGTAVPLTSTSDYMPISITKGTQEDTLTIVATTGSTVIDSAETTLWVAKREWSAKINDGDGFNNTIDPSTNFISFKSYGNDEDNETDSAIITLKDAFEDNDATCGVTADDIGVKLTSSVSEPIITGKATINGSGMTTSDNTTFEGAAGAATINGNILLLTNDGTDPISPTSFKIDAQLSFSKVGSSGIAVDNTTVLSGAAAGSWAYYGKTAYLPSVFTGGDYKTYINLFSSKVANQNTVKFVVQVMGVDGAWHSITLQDMVMEPGQKLMITGEKLVEAAKAAGVNLYESDGVYQFPARITIVSGEATGYALMRQPNGQYARVPLFNPLD